MTKKGEANPQVRDAILEFLKYYNSLTEINKRLKRGMIVAPILKDYKVPAEFPDIIKQKVSLAYSALNTEVIDVFLPESINSTLNKYIQKTASGEATPEEIAFEIEELLRL